MRRQLGDLRRASQHTPAMTGREGPAAPQRPRPQQQGNAPQNHRQRPLHTHRDGCDPTRITQAPWTEAGRGGGRTRQDLKPVGGAGTSSGGEGASSSVRTWEN